MRDIAGEILAKWGDSGGHPNYSNQQIGEILGITLGLDALFGGSLDAERRWMQTYRNELGCRPVVAILRGETARVLAIVNAERNL